MPPVRVQSVNDGQRVTVNTIVKQPRLLQARILRMFEQAFITNYLLRDAGSIPSGALIYHESTPQFADQDVEIVDEFGEIPLVMGSVGQPKMVKTVKRAAGVQISQEMRNRNDMDRLNIQLKQLRNTMIRAWEDVFLRTLLSHPDLHTIAATTVWSSTASKIRFDLGEGAKVITQSAADGDNGENRFGFNPDTLVIGETTQWDFLQSDELAKLFIGNLAAQNPQYTGVLPNKLGPFTVVKSWRLDKLAPGSALLLERGTVGGYGDERPLWVTPLYPSARENETWRSDTGRQGAVFVDQPKCACLITGVNEEA
jgi:hypothetical protein